MRRIFVYTLVFVFFLVSVAESRSRRNRRKAKRDLIAEQDLMTPDGVLENSGYMRWFRAFFVSGAQLKITRVDTSRNPDLRVHFSILTLGSNSQLEPWEDYEKLKRLEFLVAEGDQRRPKERGRLGPGGVQDESVGSDEDDEEEAPLMAMLTADEAGVPLDVVVVAAWHSGFRAVKACPVGETLCLETEHRKAVQAVLSGVSDARVNAILYGPILQTYRSFSGLENRLARYDEELGLCEVERLEARIKEGTDSDEESEVLPPPCGLHEGAGDTIAGILDTLRVRGRHARLFGLDQSGIESCVDETVASTALEHYYDFDEFGATVGDRGGFEEGLRLLLRYGRPGSRKALIVLGTGRDGFVDDDILCRRFYTQSEKPGVGCAREGDGMNSQEARQAILSCVQERLNTRSTVMQQRFQERAYNWIALARAADIRVFGLSYAFEREDGGRVSADYERERLELLSLKTGGTYREVTRPTDIPGAAESLVGELLNERVLVVADFLKSETPYRVQLRARLDFSGSAVCPDRESGECRLQAATLASEMEEFTAPFVGEGFGYWLEEQSRALKEKVGTVLYWVIIVLIILLLLLMLWLLFKLVKALVMKIVGAIFKKGKGAAKAAAKGGK